MIDSLTGEMLKAMICNHHQRSRLIEPQDAPERGDGSQAFEVHYRYVIGNGTIGLGVDIVDAAEDEALEEA